MPPKTVSAPASPLLMLFRLSFSATVAAATWLALPSIAAAQTCATDADCQRGFSCQQSVVPPDPAACPRGADCPAVAVPTTAPTTGSCQLAACATDADCGTGMVCHGETFSVCTGGTAPATPPCPPNTKCEVPPAETTPTTCTTMTRSTCAFRWQLPCNTDADCGDASFACQPTVTGTCSGGAGVGAGSAGTATPTAGAGGAAARTAPADIVTTPPDCMTTTSFPGFCQLRDPACHTDADCPAAWTCVAAPTGGGVVSGGSGSGSTTGGDGTPPPEATTTAPAAAGSTSTSPGSACQPPGYATKGGAARDAVTTGSGSTSGSPTGAGAVPPEGAKPLSTGSGCEIASGPLADTFALLATALALGAVLVARRRRA